MTNHRRSFWFSGSIPVWPSLMCFLFAARPDILMSGPPDARVSLVAAALWVTVGTLNLLWMARLTVNGTAVEIRRPFWRAARRLATGDITQVMLTRERAGLAGSGSRSGPHYCIRVRSGRDTLLSEDLWGWPRFLARPRAEQVAIALDCEFADASEATVRTIRVDANPSLLSSRSKSVRKGSDLDETVARRLRRRGGTKAAGGPAPAGLRAAESPDQLVIWMPASGLGITAGVAVLVVVMAAIAIASKTSVTLVQTAAGAIGASLLTLGWFRLMPHRISVTRRRIRWFAFPFTRSISLKRLEELDLKPGDRILARSDAAQFKIAGGDTHTAAQRKWIHAKLEKAIAELGPD